MMPEIGDIVEIVKDIPGKNIRAKMQGTVVHSHGNDVYEVEFTDDAGETVDFLALPVQHFIVVWRVETKQWIPIAEQASALIAVLPDDAARQVLDFARFMSVRNCSAAV